MESKDRYQSINFILFVVVFLSGCPNAVENASDTPTAQQRFAKSLVGSWSNKNCVLDSNTQIFHRSLEDSFADDGTFKIVRSMFAEPACNTDPVARVTYFGNFTIGKEVTAPFPAVVGKKVPAREIDYRIARSESEGHRLVAQAALDATAPFTYYDITYVEGGFRYNGSDGRVKSVAERSAQVSIEQTLVPGMKGRTAIPSPNFDAALTAANLAGTWDDGCLEDGGSADSYQNYLFTFAVPNTITVKSALWSTDDCTGTEKASVTFNGTFTVDDQVVTAVSKANAARMEMTLGAPTVAGDAVLAAASLPSNGLVGKSYFLVVHDATYDLFFYGGWFEDSLTALPTDVEYGIAKLGRTPLPRTVRTGRK